jgi:zinc finger double-stranded RNA-binding protein
MWGVTIYLMHLVDYFRGRKYKIKCRLCRRIFKNERDLDTHMRTDHKESKMNSDR